MMGPVQGAIVNWCGHRYGYRNFTTRDDSRNTLPIDFVTMGELFQNNHHRAASRLNFAWRRFEVDPTFQLLRVLDWLGVIRIEPGDDAASLAA
jgi:stearoyl-CoA desaturase (delta-9 desaturase)